MILGYCWAMYVEFVNQCTLETFMDCHIRAFHYLQGVPEEILYDNMRQVVIGRNKGKAIFNNEFKHFAHHYNFDPKVCVRRTVPGKGKAERPMDYVCQHFWRGYVYTTMEKLNRDVKT